MDKNPGKLYIVATPIGNLGDITARALDMLRQCDFVAAEDTRVARKLLGVFGIKKELVSYYEHNRRARGEYVLGRIVAGENCALTTDAGTPVVSDPGGMLVAQCREAGVEILAVPGPCAAVAAYAMAGLESTRFTFEGFLSVNRRARREHLESLRDECRPMIFYEAPHKLVATLEDFLVCFGSGRGIFIAREITKSHEESYRSTIGEVLGKYKAEAPRGEFVLVVDGAPAQKTQGDVEKAAEYAKNLVEEGVSVRDAVRQTALEFNVAKNAVYNLIK